MPAQILATKLYIPPPARDALSPPRLIQRLDDGISGNQRLFLICAPAGYGKTTLLSAWVEHLKSSPDRKIFHACWLSLEPSDSDPAVFLTYLVEALRPLLGAEHEILQAMVASPQTPPSAALISALCNALARQQHPGLLILDDLQHIHHPYIFEVLSALLEHAPASLRLVLATRSDPPLPVHRYRARGQLVELRAGDLRFTLEETQEFSGNQPLTPADVAVLGERTEGWPAGLRLALLSLAGKPDASGFIHSLSGTHRFILDYLAGEALLNQPETVQRFLLSTSILERMCAPLCAAVSGEPDSQAILDGLERAGLFVISLDDERRWFRYHHLFADLLRVRLQQHNRADPNLTVRLHSQAADWFESEGWVREAIQHRIAAGEFDRAAALVEDHTLALFAQGDLHLLVSWINLLPQELARRRPRLCITQAWALAFAGRLNDIEPLLLMAETTLPDMPGAQVLQAEILAIRSMVALISGDPPRALRLAESFPAKIPFEGLFARSVADWVQGYVWRMLGDPRRAVSFFEQVQACGQEINNSWTLLTAAVDLGTALRMCGRLRESEQVYRAGLDRVQRAGASGYGFVGRLEAFLANALLEKNNLEEACRLVELSIVHNRLWENPNHVVFSHVVRARIALSQGDLAAAEESLNAARQASTGQHVVANLACQVQVTAVRLDLLRGNLPAALRWLESRPPLWEDTTLKGSEMAGLEGSLAARIHLAAGKPAAARAILLSLEEPARAAGRNNQLIEILVLLALTPGDESAALAYLRQALDLGLPEGYCRIFLDEGQPLYTLLQKIAPRSSLLTQLLAQFEAGLPLSSSTGSDLLTGREREILACMAEGLSNIEIGRRLFISAGTVKAHSAAIYRKLDCANRSEAVARAKDLGLI